MIEYDKEYSLKDICEELHKDIAALFAEKLPEGHHLKRDIAKGTRYGSDSFSLDYALFAMEDWDTLYDLAKTREDRSVMMNVSAFRNALTNPTKNRISGIRSLLPGLVKFILTDIIDGWFYRIDERGNPLPFLVTSIHYHEPRDKDDRPSVSLRMLTNGAIGGRQATDGVTFFSDDCTKTTIPELLAKHGLHHETPELKARYLEDLHTFLDRRQQHNLQYWLLGTSYTDPMEDDYSFRRQNQGRAKRVFERAKVVNDEAIAQRKFTARHDRNWWERRAETDRDILKVIQHTADTSSTEAATDLFTQVPYHPYIKVFHLDTTLYKLRISVFQFL